jgi:hypothetical protein
MSTALAVSQHDLVLPNGALFHPKMLMVGPSTTKVEYQQLCSGLAKIDDAGQLWVCDAALWGMQRFGREEGLELAHAATGYTKCTLKKLAYIASRFTPDHRPDGFTRSHFKTLLPFPQEWLNTWLPTISNRKLKAKGVRALAVEAFGSDPSWRPVKKVRQVNIPAAIYARLVELNQTRPSALVEAIITEWLSMSREEQLACLGVASESKKEAKNERERAKRAKIAEREAEMRARRDKQEAGKLAQKEQIAAFNAAERAKRDAERVTRDEKKQEEMLARQVKKEAERAVHRAEKIATKLKNRADREAERVKNQSIRGIEISLHGSCAIGKTSKWLTLEEASTAAARYEAAKNYPIEGFKCDKCNFFHIRCDEARMAEAFARAKQRAREIQAHVGSVESDDPASSYAETRPNYAQRRQAPICIDEGKAKAPGPADGAG